MMGPGGGLEKLQAVSFGAEPTGPTGGNGGGGPGGGDEKKNKVKPMSKKISTALSQTSSKMTEILAWQAKLQENKAGLLLAKVYWSRHIYIYIYIFPHLCIDHETYNVCVCLCSCFFQTFKNDLHEQKNPRLKFEEILF